MHAHIQIQYILLLITMHMHVSTSCTYMNTIYTIIWTLILSLPPFTLFPSFSLWDKELVVSSIICYDSLYQSMHTCACVWDRLRKSYAASMCVCVCVCNMTVSMHTCAFVWERLKKSYAATVLACVCVCVFKAKPKYFTVTCDMYFWYQI